MAAPERQLQSGRPRRARLRRGPLTIGDPAPAISALLAGGDPYRPDTVADGGGAFGLIVRAASVRGLSKRFSGGPRQDDLCLRVHAPSRTVVAAVADGVSGAARSDVGAALAVRHAVAAVIRQLDGATAALDWDDVFGQAAWALVEEQRRAGGDPHAGVQEASAVLATTLLVATITAPAQVQASGHVGAPAQVQASGHVGAIAQSAAVEVAAIGDSPALLLEGRGLTALVGDPQLTGGLLGGGVRSLPRAARAPASATCELCAGAVLLLCTDGLALPLAGGAGDVGQTLVRELRRPPDPIDFARLLDFSRATYDDDRTLVAVWCPGGA